MVKVKLQDCGDGEWAAKLPAVGRGLKNDDWEVIIECNRYDEWYAKIYGGRGHTDALELCVNTMYTRKSHAVRGLNRLIKRLGWPYEVVG